MLKLQIKWLLLLVFAHSVNCTAQEWENLLDQDLSKWEIWMGIPHVSTGLPGATSTTGTNGGTPLGLNNDPLNVFSMITEDGEDVLKITGEVYGGLTTLSDYSNYHLYMQFKWGQDKYEPRLNRLRDSGILYHCQGDHGSFWDVWKSSIEYQVQEGDCGDYIGLAGAQGYIQSESRRFSPGQPLASPTLVQASQNFEVPNGEWNTLEVITVGDKSMHFVNGNLINAVENMEYNGSSISSGQIQIQSEGAELYYRDIKIKAVTDFPADEKSILGWDGSDPGFESDAPIGSVIKLQKSGGDQKYVSVNQDSDNQLVANASFDEGEEFTVEAHPNGGVALKSNSTGKYVQVQGNGTTDNYVRAQGSAAGTWERFEWLTRGANQVALRSVFIGTWIQAAYGVSNSTLFPKGEAAGTWETFNIEVISEGETTDPSTEKAKVLVFNKTNGFRHSSIDDGINMIRQQGIANGLWDTDDTTDASAFTATNLEQYNVVIWCNTTGDGLLSSTQQVAFEQYIRNGGGFVGIHSATDTYRDGSWPFYNDLVGAIVQTSPYHTSSNHNATMTINESSHSTVEFLGPTWNKTEEYYYWKNNGGQLYDGNINVLTVEATGSNDYDEARPMAWYKEYEGGRSFYTALGHNDSDYSDDTNFMRHVEEGIIWAGNLNDTTIPPSSDNIALAGTATQSSTNHNGQASRAIDGDTNGEYSDDSVTHTSTEDNAWWQVSLAAQKNIGEIAIYNRVGCCQDRLSNFTVLVIDSNGNTTYQETLTTTPTNSVTVDANGALGKIVKIQSNLLATPLSLAEVEVYEGESSTSFLRLEAEDADEEAGTQVEKYNDTSYNVGFINNNDWLKFENVNLTDVKTLKGHVASRFQGGDIEVRLGSTSGTLIATMPIVNTGENHDYEIFETSINEVSGTHDVYFVFTGGTGFLFNVDWLEFTLTATTTVEIVRLEAEESDQSSGVQVEKYSDTSFNIGFIDNNDWVKYNDVNLSGIKSLTAHVASRFVGGDIEVRLNSITGTLIGSMPIVNTGENHDYELFETSISEVSGTYDVYFVFTGGTGFLFNVDWFEFSDTDRSEKIVSTLNKVEITAYPNPTNGTLTVTNFGENAEISVIDIWGKQIPVTQFMVNNNMYVLDLTTLTTGMYILQVNGSTQTIIKN